MRKLFLNRYFLGILLLIISGAAFAADGGGTSNATLHSLPVDSHTDLSLAYLSQIFGNVGTSLQGESGQMLGHLLYKFNQGVLVVAGFWLVYTVFTVILRSAQEGSFMGQNKNVALVLLKLALGIAFLVPSSATGYSLLQDTVMKVVVEGVSLADLVWDNGIDYIDNGGSLWHRPEVTDSRNPLFGPGTADAIFARIGYPVFQMETCMYASAMVSGQGANVQNAMQNGGFGGAGNSTAFSPNYHGNVVSFPGVGDQSSTGSSCGSIDASKISHATDSPAQLEFAKDALQGMVTSMLPAAKEYACTHRPAGAEGGYACAGVNSNDVAADNGQTFYGAMLGYANSVQPMAQAATSDGSKASKKFFKDARTSGWLTAGRYYWDMSRIQAHYMNAGSIDGYVPSSVNQPGSWPTAVSDTMANIDQDQKTYAGIAVGYLKNNNKAQSAGDTGGYYAGGIAETGNLILSIVLGPLITDMMGIIMSFSSHMGPFGMGPDPIAFLHNVGMHCIALAGDIWFLVTGLLFVGFLPAAICPAVNGIGSPMNAAASWIKPPLTMIAGMFFTVGIMLGYYVPMYPFMIFTFGVISWLISVIEAMVAAPLVALGLTHPEGHDFLGESKQGLMLILGVFLRPALMVIGMIAAMILSYVSLRILVYTYSGFILDLFYPVSPVPGSAGDVLGATTVAMTNVAASSGSITGLIMSLLAFPIFLAIFAMIVYVVTNKCFSLVYVLPDYILRWIGGPQSPQEMSAGQMAQQVGGMVQSGSQQTGQAITQAAKLKAMQRAKEAKMNKNSSSGGSKKQSGGGAGAGGGNTPTISTSGGAGGAGAGGAGGAG